MNKIAVSENDRNDDDDARCFCLLFLCDIILSVPIFFRFKQNALNLCPDTFETNSFLTISWRSVSVSLSKVEEPFVTPPRPGLDN